MYTEESRIGELLENEKASHILFKYLPGFAGSTQLGFVKWQPLKRVIRSKEEWSLSEEISGPLG